MTTKLVWRVIATISAAAVISIGGRAWIRKNRATALQPIQVSPSALSRAPEIIHEKETPQGNDPKHMEELEKLGMAEAGDGRFKESRQHLLEAVRPFEEWEADKEPPYSTNNDAALQLGLMLRDGHGGPKDPIGAARCFVLAIRGEGSPMDAYLHLEMMYRTGAGVPRDLKFADLIQHSLHLRATRDPLSWTWRHPDAIRLAEKVIQGDKFPRDLVVAAKLYYVAEDKATCRKVLEQACQEGSIEAHMWLANSFLGGGWPVTEKDPIKAIDHFQIAGNLGHAEAWFELGRMYKWGTLVQPDDAKAFECFQKAPRQSAYFLGLAYWEGKVTERDAVKARNFLIPVVQGDYFQSDALAVLASIYGDGVGVAKDPVLAARYSPLVAVKETVPPAKPRVGRPWEGDPQRVVNIQKLLTQKAPATSWLEYGKALMKATRISSAAIAFGRAMDLGSADAELLLGQLYSGDWGMSGDDMSAVIEPLPLDSSKGKALLDSAAKKGKRPPLISGEDDRGDMFKAAKEKADKYSGQDPRRLFYLIEAWSWEDGC